MKKYFIIFLITSQFFYLKNKENFSMELKNLSEIDLGYLVKEHESQKVKKYDLIVPFLFNKVDITLPNCFLYLYIINM